MVVMKMSTFLNYRCTLYTHLNVYCTDSERSTCSPVVFSVKFLLKGNVFDC